MVIPPLAGGDTTKTRFKGTVGTAGTANTAGTAGAAGTAGTAGTTGTTGTGNGFGRAPCRTYRNP